MPNPTKQDLSGMTPEVASRIQSTADKNPQSKTAKSGFKERAMSAAAKNTQGEEFDEQQELPRMTPEKASCIQSQADRDPGSEAAQPGFKERAMSAAAKNTQAAGAENIQRHQQQQRQERLH